jgi:hypothetical protein
MADPLSYRRSKGGAKGDTLLDEVADGKPGTDLALKPNDPMDGPEARALHRKLMSWFYFERDRQAGNRMEMAIDHDFYDGEQWDQESLDTLEARRQLPVVYNEVAPMCDWMIGTERRNRVDWKVLPRSPDDVKMADVKTQTLKYVADVNHVAHNRSRAFADAVKVGIGWLEDGVRADPTADPLYSRYVDWRCILHDSTAYDYLGDEGRYNFKWRWVDADVACLMFPKRAGKIKSSVEDWSHEVDSLVDEMDWQTPGSDATFAKRSGTLSPLSGTTVAVDAQRQRVRLIECQYREPTIVKFVGDGPMKGVMFDERDKVLVQTVAEKGYSIIDRLTMRVHVAVFTESDMIAMGPSVYRHNKFSRTPIICYIKGRDRQPYGMVRRVRTIQQDINKRASKANWLVNTNQLIGDENAFEDWEAAREEAQDPQGVLPHRVGAQVEIRRDAEAAKGQLDMMQIGVQAIQRNSVTNENLGRQTNATSEVAIRARQLQGSVTTTEPFDNQRHAVKAQGEKQLSLVEQFYTEEKVLRLTGGKGPIQWLRINEPEVQPDGSVRWINDITSSTADFVVEEADYAGTLRQVMFDSLTQLSQRLPPEIALRLLRMAFEFSDLPNKDEIASEIRRLTGEADPEKELTPEEQQAQAQQQEAQAEAAQIQRELALATLQEQQAKSRKVSAEAEKVMAEIEALRLNGGVDDMQTRIEQAAQKVREQAASEIDALGQQLAKVTASNEAALFKTRTDADTAAEVERIRASSAERVAEIQKASDTEIAALQKRIDDLAGMLKEVSAKASEPAPAPAPPPPAPPAPAPAPAAPAAEPAPAPKAARKTIRLKREKDGSIVGNVEGDASKTIRMTRDKDGAVVATIDQGEPTP